MRTISIKGEGKAKRDPDLVILKITTSTQRKEYAETIEASNELVNKLKNDFKSIGFKKEELKTVNFYTRPIYQSVEVGVVNKRHERQLQCFEANHDLKIEFDLDNDVINRVFRCLKNFKRGVDFEISFTVKDKDSMKRDVIIDATKNAKFNAEALAEASSVRLGDLIKIEYNWTDFYFHSKAHFDCDVNYMMDSSDYVEFNPDSIEITDTVAFVWEIE